MKRYSPLIMLLVLLGALAVSQVATAASTSRPVPTFAHQNLRADDAEEPEDESEAEDGEFEFEECEADDVEEFEFEEGEDEEFEEEEFDSSCGDDGANGGKADSKDSPFVTAPAACQVRQAESTVTTVPGSDQVRISVNYRTYAPTQVAVGVKLKDGKGSLAIEQATRHLGDKGVLHLTAKLGAAAMDRAVDAREFDVSLRAPKTPAFCAGDLEQRLQRAQAARVYSN